MPSTAEFIAEFEGCRLDAYHDIAGYPTIGIGHKLSDEKWADLSQWPPITREQALSQLDVHLDHFRGAVHRLIDFGRLQPNQETALVSFAFNLGAGALERSRLRGMVGNYLRGAGHASEGPALVLEWLDWCKATIDGRKQVVDGLLRRRRAEVALFFGLAT